MTKGSIEKIIANNRRPFAVHQLWAEFDRTERERDAYKRSVENAHAELDKIKRALAALKSYNDAFDAQPWATDEPARIQLDRITERLRAAESLANIRSQPHAEDKELRAIYSKMDEEGPLRCLVCGGLEPCSHNFDTITWPNAVVTHAAC